MFFGKLHSFNFIESEVATFDTRFDLLLFPQVCAVDNRGTGYSGYPPGEIRWTTQRMAQDALAVLDDLKWQKVHIIGISMGGMIAQEMWWKTWEGHKSMTCSRIPWLLIVKKCPKLKQNEK